MRNYSGEHRNFSNFVVVQNPQNMTYEELEKQLAEYYMYKRLSEQEFQLAAEKSGSNPIDDFGVASELNIKLFELLDRADAILKEYSKHSYNIRHTIEGLIEYAEKKANTHREKDIYAAQEIGHAIELKFLHRYLPYEIYEKVEKRLEKLRYLEEPTNMLQVNVAPISTNLLQTSTGVHTSAGISQIQHEEEEIELPSPCQTQQSNSTEPSYLSLRIFTSEEEEEKWANIIKQFIADNNITAPLDGSMKNPTLAMIHHFYEKWQTQNRLLRTKIKAQDVLDFFIQKCGVKKKIQKSGEPVKDKTITNKIDGLKSKSNKLNDTPEITNIEVAIKKVWKTYTCAK